MPFQSEKQRRYLWANEPEIARDWTDTYGSRIQKILVVYHSQLNLVVMVNDQGIVVRMQQRDLLLSQLMLVTQQVLQVHLNMVFTEKKEYLRTKETEEIMKVQLMLLTKDAKLIYEERTLKLKKRKKLSQRKPIFGIQELTKLTNGLMLKIQSGLKKIKLKKIKL